MPCGTTSSSVSFAVSDASRTPTASLTMSPRERPAPPSLSEIRLSIGDLGVALQPHRLQVNIDVLERRVCRKMSHLNREG